MISEWMKVMLDEVSRKKAEAEQACAEEQARAEEKTRADERRRVVVESSTCAREKKIGDAE